MGQRRDGRIQDFQKRAGITPATGDRSALLARMSKLAHELIQVIALEQSGIRDGDGQWGGCDPIGSIVHELGELEKQDLATWKAGNPPDRVEGVMDQRAIQ